ncbi:MAG: DNA polymerase III subunit delta' [Proteobacteria bacterium]|nr:DNA polymerase III subunit delta' [Pseudomonadota bacterium]
MSFSNVIGHERALGLLKAMLVNGRLPHALLISGPVGVGKYTTALALAQAVNCLEPVAGLPCGTCRACSKIARGQHPDVSVLEPEGRLRLIRIEHVRELRTQINYRPFEGRTKVYIVREADRMQDPQANALLKTLEEPPSQSLLILTTPEESDLLPTIVSRCLRLHLAPLPRETIEAWLARERGLEGPRARYMASLAEGCLGRVIDLDADEVWQHRIEVTNRLSRLAPDRIEPALDWAAELAGAPDNWPAVFGLLRFWYRDLLVLAGGAGRRHLVNDDLAAELEASGGNRDAGAFLSALDEIERAEDALRRLIRPELVFENLLIGLSDLVGT